MKPITTWSLLSLLFLLAAYWMNTSIIQTTLTYKDTKQEYARYLSYENRLLDYKEWFDKDTWKEKKVAAKKLKTQIAQSEAQQQSHVLYLLLVMLLYGGLSFWFFKRQHPQYFIATLIFIALAALHLGLFAPMLEIAAFETDLTIPIKVETGVLSLKFNREQVFEGDLFFYYQSKSVVELITTLFKQSNYVVGIAILLFSVLLPIAKIITTLLVLLKRSLFHNPIVYFISSKTSKWSMADVFVVAVFLAYLAFNNMQTGISTESNVLIGLYFFLGYCMLSIMASVLTEKWIKN